MKRTKTSEKDLEFLKKKRYVLSFDMNQMISLQCGLELFLESCDLEENRSGVPLDPEFRSGLTEALEKITKKLD